MSETMVAFGERTIRSGKDLIYRYSDNFDTGAIKNCFNSPQPLIPEKVTR